MSSNNDSNGANEDRAVLLAIHAVMDGTEWGADTLETIAELLAAVGLPCREPTDTEEAQ